MSNQKPFFYRKHIATQPIDFFLNTITFNPHQNGSGGHIIASTKMTYKRLALLDRFTLQPQLLFDFAPSESPSGLCLQPITNHLIVCDEWNDKLKVLLLSTNNKSTNNNSIDPILIFDIGKKPTPDADGFFPTFKKNGEFGHPQGVCCKPDGSICVTDSFNNRSQLFDSAGRYLLSNNYDFTHPMSICYFHPLSLVSGIFCVSNFYTTRVYVHSDDQFLFDFQASGYVTGLCVDMNGFLHVSCGYPSYEIQIFDFRMVHKNKPTLFDTIEKDCLDRIGYVCPTTLCVDNENVLIFADCEKKISFWGENKLILQ